MPSVWKALALTVRQEADPLDGRHDLGEQELAEHDLPLVLERELGALLDRHLLVRTGRTKRRSRAFAERTADGDGAVNEAIATLTAQPIKVPSPELFQRLQSAFAAGK